MSQKSLNDQIEEKHYEIFRAYISNDETRRQRLWEELAALERQEREGQMGKDPQDLRDHKGTVR